ncbi:hypothetical protein ACHAXT_005573 [Thalassiosira profunda]
MVTMVDEDTPADGNEGRPPLISLRLPAALLSSLDDESRLGIDHGTVGSAGDGGDGSADAVGPSLTIAAGGTRDVHPLEATASDRSTEYYQSASTTEGANGSRDLYSIGRTNQQYTLKPKSAADLKEIGKKTRRLLEEERKKRKEIVRLDESDLPLPEKETAGGKNPPPDEDGKPPPKKTGRAAINPRKRKRLVASNVDGWIPDVDELVAAATTKEDRSNIVRLHGLPVGAKPEHVRKFFDGLNPSLIFVLPSFDSHINGWDADYDAVERKEAVVRRYPSNFRVYVEFTSVLVAEAAIERSGESMGFEATSTASEKRGFVGASISLSPVPKDVAAFLHEHLAIHTRKGERIFDTMKKNERRMGEAVAEMSWQMAKKRLKLKRHLKDKQTTSHDHLSEEYALPKDRSQYFELAKVYNRLIDTHERLELNSSVLLTHTFDPSLLEDSVHRITSAVSEWLLDEIEILARVLKESRLRMGI